MAERMLKFVGTPQALPAKRPAAERRTAMHAANPVYIPRNHRVEAMIQAAVENQDYAPFEEMLRVLMTPYEEQPGAEAYAEGPGESERVYRTFCGT